MRYRFFFTLIVLAFVGCTHSVTAVNPGLPALALPDSVKSWLNGEAPIIGFYGAVALDSSYTDTIALPQWASTRAYNAIGRIWETKSLVRDTIFDIYPSTTIGDNDFHTVFLCSDSLTNFGSLIAQYQFVDSTIFGEPAIVTPLIVNTDAVVNAINDSLGFLCAEDDGYTGGNLNAVKAVFGNGITTMSFTYGWGDCSNGCIDSRTWNFNVTDSGIVTYLGASGDAPPH